MLLKEIIIETYYIVMSEEEIFIEKKYKKIKHLEKTIR